MTKLKRNIPLFFLIRTATSFQFERGIFVLYLIYSGLTEMQISVLQVMLFLMIMVFEVPIGIFADAFGRKAAILSYGVTMSVYAIGMIFADDFWLFLLLFSTAALSFSLISGAETAIIYDTLKALKRSDEFVKINSRLMAINGVVFAISLVIGGFLQEWGGWPLVYWSFFAINVVAVLIASFLIEPPINETLKTAEIESFGAKIKEYKDAFRDPNIKRIMLFVLAMAFFEGMLTPLYIYAQTLFSSRGLSIGQIGLIYGLVELISACMLFLAPFMDQRFGIKRFLYFSIVFTFICMLFLGFQSAFIVVAAFVILFSLPEARRPLHENYFNSRIPSELRASLISTESMIESFLLIFLYLYYGVAMGSMDVGLVIVSTAVLCPISLWILWLYFQTPAPEIEVEITS